MKKLISLCSLLLISFTLFAERPILKDVQAKNGTGTKINVFWSIPENTDKEITSIQVYRSTKQISSVKILHSSKLIAELPGYATGYVDSLKDFKDYYYAVIAVTDKPYEIIMLSINSTAKSVHLEPAKKKEVPVEKKEEEKTYNDGTMREIPLPYLAIVEGLDEESQISEKTVERLSSFASKTKSSQKGKEEPYFFEEDLVSPDGGDDYLLFDILKTTFVQEKYSDSIELLQRLTKTRVAKAVQDRAAFYLAEAYYYTENYPEAISILISLEQTYPLLAKKWINASLDGMKLKK